MLAYTAAEDGYKRRVAAGVRIKSSCACRHIPCLPAAISGKWRKSYPTAGHACSDWPKRGWPKPERCNSQLWSLALKIRHGHGAPVVVRDGESPSHGEGGQFTLQCNKGRMREALLEVPKLYWKIYRGSPKSKTTGLSVCTGISTTRTSTCWRIRICTPTREP